MHNNKSSSSLVVSLSSLYIYGRDSELLLLSIRMLNNLRNVYVRKHSSRQKKVQRLGKYISTSRVMDIIQCFDFFLLSDKRKVKFSTCVILTLTFLKIESRGE